MSPWPALVSLLALLLYFVVTINVGRARAKYGIPAPQMSGNPDFERVLRVQQNMLEQLIFFLPALWIFCFYLNPLWGSGLGMLWVGGRALYAWGYYQAAEKRGPGFAIASLSSLVLVLAGLVGVVLALIPA
ncbi:MAPEG family protein [Acaryochloris sp. 'Moss Beach']|uniref:MAPEG family protein n=1 Tax=Acaryochloris TaxID=155977 RepID=UPI001BB0549D|nr:MULTISPECIES: MAPEG family protein [Acaryochloris]QUY43386.1 MAPEG family protein [Acaryochloris marina S15]UJB68216.1 MAPEG family protein [Acaryochloris sp. 'Moss Beach']